MGETKSNKLNSNGSDVISSFIKKIIPSYEESKKFVLVIDDLDGLDPEDIFRILNVFSAFNDVDSGEK